MTEISKAIKIIESTGKNKITFLHGFQAYPTKIEDTNLDRLKFFKSCFGNKVNLGLSEHIEGDNILSKVIPIMALPYGINIIENMLR